MLSLPRAQVQSLVGELKFHKLTPLKVYYFKKLKKKKVEHHQIFKIFIFHD